MCFHVVPCMFIKRQLPLVSPTKALIASANNVYITSDVVVRVIYLSSAVMKTLTVIIRSCRRPCVCVCIGRAQGKIWQNTSSSTSIYWQPFCCPLDGIRRNQCACGECKACDAAAQRNAELLLSSRYHFRVGFLDKVCRSRLELQTTAKSKRDEQCIIFVASNV